MQSLASLKESIDKKSVLKINYGGERIIEPHGIFEDKQGEVFITAYQTEGYSESGGLPHWRSFPINKTSNIQKTGKTFQKRLTFNPWNRSVYHKMIYCVK